MPWTSSSPTRARASARRSASSACSCASSARARPDRARPLAREFVLVRHGQTEWNLAQRLQGHADSPLTDLGRRQAAAHGERLAELRPDLIVASPLGRARITAAIVAARLGLPVEHDEALRERGIGAFEGRSYAWIAANRPDEHAARRADPWHWRPPGGESFEDLLVRTRPLLARLRSHPAERILLVSHSALARPLLGQLLDLDAPAMLDVRVPNDLAYRVCLDGAVALVTRIDDDGERPGLLTGALAESLHYDPASPPAPPDAGPQN